MNIKYITTGMTLLHLVFALNVSAGEIHKLAADGNLSKLESLLEKTPKQDVDMVDGEGQTALYVAAKYGHVETVAFLVRKGADFTHSKPGPFGTQGTALHIAIERGNVNTVSSLLSLGADANQPDAGVGTPLHAVLRQPNPEIEKILRSYGAAPVNAPSINHLLSKANIRLGKEVSVTCSVCHDLGAEPGSQQKSGPPLWGVVGRAIGSVSSYPYSTEMNTNKGEWSIQNLNSFLSNPRAYLPGTKMQWLSGIKDDKRRAALIVYLRGLSKNPLPLP